MGWGEWAARIGGYALAPWTGGASIAIGEGIAQGLHSKDALKDATATQQAATDKAIGQQQGALRTAGDVYGQQRQDTQNLANVPYQTLGGLMGITIPNIGPPSGMVPTTASPSGFSSSLMPANQTRPLGVSAPGDPATPSDLVPYRGVPFQDGATLAQLAQQMTPEARRAMSRSGYDPRRA